MAQCLQCKIEFKAERKSAKYCSNKCKLAYHKSRDSVSKDAKISVSKPPVSVSEDTLKQADTLTDTLKKNAKDTLKYTLTDQKFAGRQAVIYPNDKFESRPKPDNDKDTPDPDNRNIFKRPDNTEYVIDAVGKTIEWEAQEYEEKEPKFIPNKDRKRRVKIYS